MGQNAWALDCDSIPDNVRMSFLASVHCNRSVKVTGRPRWDQSGVINVVKAQLQSVEKKNIAKTEM